MISGIPIFACSDVPATLAYYKDVLGFDTSWTWGDPPNFGSVSKGAVTIMFNLQPDLASNVAGHQHAINVEDPDAMFEMHRSRGAKILSEPENKPWGLREYLVEDPSGYHLRIGGPVTTSAKPSDPFPKGVRIERRIPTQEEFSAVAGEAFYRDGAPEGVLERTWRGVVALGPNHECIGTVRIMYDAPGWFSVWDVAVTPQWQGKRIGEAMMKEAIATVEEASPGAFVFLFTFKHGFYEKLGFNVGTVSMLKV